MRYVAGAIGSWINSHLIVTILIVGLFIRATLSCLFTYCYDVSFWALVIENIQSGSGLYELPGYYYTPVWGYFIAVIGMFADFALGMDVFGTQVGAFVGVQNIDWGFYLDLITTVEFNLLFKIFFTLIDIAVSYVLYQIVLLQTSSQKKAAIAFGLWFLCPIVVYTSCVQAMFDSLSVLFMVLTVYMLIKRRYFPAGLSYAAAAMTKYFPAYLVFVMIGYVLLCNRDDRKEAYRSVGLCVLGAALMLFVILLPNILDGDVLTVFAFITSRVGSIGESDGSFLDSLSSNGYTLVLLLQPVILILELLFANNLRKSPSEEAEGNFIFYCLLASAAVFLWTPVPSYMMIIVPFIICHFIVSDRRYKLSMIALFAIPVSYAVVLQNVGDLFQTASFLGLISTDSVINGLEWLGSASLGGLTNMSLLSLLFGAMETIAIYSVFLTFIRNRCEDRKGAVD